MSAFIKLSIFLILLFNVQIATAFTFADFLSSCEKTKNSGYGITKLPVSSDSFEMAVCLGYFEALSQAGKTDCTFPEEPFQGRNGGEGVEILRYSASSKQLIQSFINQAEANPQL